MSPEDTTDHGIVWNLTGNGQILSQSGLTCTVSLTGNTTYNSTLSVTSVAVSSVTTSVTLTHTSNQLTEIQVKYGSTTINNGVSIDTYDGHIYNASFNVVYVPSNTTQTGITVSKTGSSNIQIDTYNSNVINVRFSVTGNVPISQAETATITVTSTANSNIKKTFVLSVYSTYH